ncbi:hypothetical protein LOK49_LG14G01807 [Camellia lanceoleosa]|uniref:Uncharacterized protein n=1 Tax=Camellia lanceoleosa TaxID=1840588 RepID=A0ACC0FDJ3_9ERIC|nr:hypothetical protein LOK49_LG14G01807 [Camellia lanceoleosa]
MFVSFLVPTQGSTTVEVLRIIGALEPSTIVNLLVLTPAMMRLEALRTMVALEPSRLVSLLVLTVALMRVKGPTTMVSLELSRVAFFVERPHTRRPHRSEANSAVVEDLGFKEGRQGETSSRGGFGQIRPYSAVEDSNDDVVGVIGVRAKCESELG